MELSSDPTISRFQRIYEKVLLWAAIALLEFHMLHCPYRELVKNYSIFMNIERWFGCLLAVAAVIYLILSATTFHTMPRVKAYLSRFRSFEQYFLIFYFLWYIFTVAVRQHFMGQYHEPGFYFSDNDWWMFITGLIAFIMFPLARATGNEKMEKLVPVMFKIILIPNIIFHAWALWQYLHMNTVIFPSGALLEMDDASMHIGANRNTTGAYSLTMLTLCIYLIATQKSWKKIPYTIGAIVYYAVMILSNCRTSWYSCLITAMVACFLFAWFSLKTNKSALRFSAGLILSFCCVILLNWSRIYFFQILDSAIASSQELVNSQATTFPAENTVAPSPLTVHIAVSPRYSSVVLDSARTFESGLSGREPIFWAALYVMFHSIYCFLLGVTPSDVGTILYGFPGVIKVYPHAHNFFLQMGMSYGVPFMLLTVAFTVSLAIKSLRILFRYGDKLSSGAWMIPVICLCMLSQDLMEAFLNSGGTMVTVAFYLFAGWIVALDRELSASQGEIAKVERTKVTL